jgi:hypothetical protein
MILLTDEKNIDERSILIGKGHPLYWEGPLPLYREFIKTPAAREILNKIYLLNRDGVVYLQGEKIYSFMEDIRREINSKASAAIGTPKGGEILLKADIRLETYTTVSEKNIILKARFVKEGWLLEPDLLLLRVTDRLGLDKKDFAEKHRKHAAGKETRLILNNVSAIDPNDNLTVDELERYEKISIDLLTSPLKKKECSTRPSRASSPWE